ncbi:MAG TPA: DUF2683 family protein [Hanamia sp.]
MEAIIVRPNTKAEAAALKTIFKVMKIPFENATTEESPYNTAFERKMEKANADKKAGRYKAIKTADLWK